MDYILEVIRSLGLTASNVEPLVASGLRQSQKVARYIALADVVLALVTFDKENPGGKSARPNLYNELQTSLLNKPDGTIVLREVKDSIPVDLGSNLEGQISEIRFSQGELYKAIPRLLVELRAQGLFRTDLPGESTFEAGSILNSFLDEMDKIWDFEFDVAWEQMMLTSRDHERDFATVLDEFFQDYQRVFSALIRESKRGADLRRVADEMLGDAWSRAVRAWEVVVDAKRNRATQAVSAYRRRGGEPQAFRDALLLVEKAKRQPGSPQDKIAALRRAIDALDRIIDRKGKR